MKKVLIIYKYLPQYRVEFFHLLKAKLEAHDVDLQFVHGKSNKIDALKKDEASIDWARVIENKELRFGKKVLIWQPVLKELRDKDMVITLPENKLVLNYYLMIAKFFSKYKFSFWGHAYNMQNDVDDMRNKAKLMFLNRCDWWFAYTKSAKDFLISRGFNKNHITIVQNAIDTSDLIKYYNTIDAGQVDKLKEELNITGDNVGIYCGSMYPDKDFDFILAACYRIKEKVKDFHMVFVGSGVESYKIEKAAETNDWIHYVGPKFGNARVIYFKISSIQLMPRLVGLAIVDSFATETPIITTTHPFHGPEVDYLENGVNGIMTDDDIDTYSNAVAELLQTKKYLNMIENCKKSAGVYTVENMAENFKEGILSCLGI